MLNRKFGKTGFECSEIGLGTWQMGSMWGPRDDAQALQAIARALEMGINLIDTAAVYGNGHSEQLIGQLIKKPKRSAFIATKIPPMNHQWPARHHVPVSEAFTKQHVINATEKSLKNLQREVIDLQQLHVWSDHWLNQGDWVDGIEQLKRQGKIRHFGVSMNDHEASSALQIVNSGLIDSVQVIYNIFDQRPEEKLFPLCQEKGVAVIVRVPFDEGSLTGVLTPDVTFHKKDWRSHYFSPDRLKETCERIEKIKGLIHEDAPSLPLLALKFCLHHPAVSTVIPGMRKVRHVEENHQASDGKPLSQEIIRALTQHAWPRNFYPSYG